MTLTTEAAAQHPRRHDYLALIVLVLLATIFFGDVLFGFSNFYMRDLTRYYYPAKHILREIALHGEFPFWNPYFSAGQPIAANPEHEVFYPLTWLILLPSYDFGYRLLILIHVYIGLFAMYALLRSMDLAPFACFIGALSFGMGGLYLSYINLLPILFCAAWLPLTCLYVRKFLLRRTLRSFALGSLFLGLQFLVAEPTTIMQTGLLLGMYALYRAWYSPQRRVTKFITRVLWIALISLSGFLVGAAQFLPALDHLRDSARARPFEFDLVSAWSMPFAKFAELIFPNILGHISLDRVMWYWGGGLYPGMGSPFLFSIYTGLLILALAIGGAFLRPRGGRFTLILCALSAILALGGHIPFLNLLYKAGIATSIRYPEKFALIGVFAITLFAAQMLDRLLRGDRDLRDAMIGFALATTTIALAVSISTFTPFYAKAFLRVWGQTAGPAATRMISISRIDWYAATLRGAVLACILWMAATRRRTLWMAALAVFVCLDLGLVVYELNPRMPRKFFDSPPAATAFPANRQPFRVFHEADWYGTSDVARKFFSTGSAVYWQVRNGLFPMTPAGSGLRTVMERDYDKTALLPTVDFSDSIWDVKRSGITNWAEPFMAMSNAWYRGEYRDYNEAAREVGNHMERSRPIRFVEGVKYPRYYFANQVVTIRDRDDFVKKLSKGGFSSRVAFVSRPSFVPAAGTVFSVHETANSARLDVESAGQGFLVMSVTPHKYWHIEVDGLHVPAVVTNIGYQGIIVTPGRHRVTMRYRNELVTVGSMISILSILVLAVAAAVRPQPEPDPPAYREPVHIIADPDGIHLEAVELMPDEGQDEETIDA